MAILSDETLKNLKKKFKELLKAEENEKNKS